MLSRLYSPSCSEDGFTLIELLIVVIIIGILAAIALPIFLNQQKVTADASVQSDVRNTVGGVQTWIAQHPATKESNSSALTAAGGNVVQSGKNTVDMVVNTDGSYTVCGFGPNGSQFTSTNAAYLYDSTTGKFGLSTSGCPGDVATPPTAGYDSSSQTTTVTFEQNDPYRSEYFYDNSSFTGIHFLSTNQAHSGSYSLENIFAPGNGIGIKEIQVHSNSTSGGHNPAMVKGQKYTISFWMYVHSADGVGGANYAYSSVDGIFNMTTLDKWVQVTNTITYDPTYGGFTLTYFPGSQGTAAIDGGGEVDVYLDDLTVTPAA